MSERIIVNEKGARAAINILISKSAPFEVVPLPDDNWAVYVKGEHYPKIYRLIYQQEYRPNPEEVGEDGASVAYERALCKCGHNRSHHYRRHCSFEWRDEDRDWHMCGCSGFEEREKS